MTLLNLLSFAIGASAMSIAPRQVPPGSNWTQPTGPAVKVNSYGYLPDGPKLASVVVSGNGNYSTGGSANASWSLINEAGDVSATGQIGQVLDDAASELRVGTIDFSSVTEEGTGYTLRVGNDESYPFAIGSDIYQPLITDALQYYYQQRSGIAIDGGLVGEEYARPAGHLQVAPNRGDLVVPCQATNDSLSVFGEAWTCDYSLDVRGGWYDAGDHGKYVVNGGISTTQLLMTYERNQLVAAEKLDLGDGTLRVPEQGNGIPDILDEARWHLEFMMKMQVPADSEPQLFDGELVDMSGLVHHKIHDNVWTSLPLDPTDDSMLRELHRPGTSASLNLAGAAALAARLFRGIDDEFAEQALEAAKTSYAAALRNPAIYAPVEDGANGGGPYDDSDVIDEFYHAAVELYITTGEAEYYSDFLSNPYQNASIAQAFSLPEGFSWPTLAALGRLQLATVPSDLPAETKRTIQDSVLAAADYLIENVQESSINAFGVFLLGYPWGSNSNALNNQQVVATAADIASSRDDTAAATKYRNAAISGFDYMFGRNALAQSYVIGYGSQFTEFIHSRLYAPSLDPSSPRAPAGSLAGGANQNPSDPPSDEFLVGCAPQKCYIDDVESYSTNEIALNWNSALVWNVAWVLSY